MPYPNLLASGVTNGTPFAPFDLWAGEAEIVTSQGTAGATLAQFQVVARAATGNKLVVWVPGATDLTGKPIGFTMQAAVNNGPVMFCVGGAPRHDALVWPGAITTLDARKAAFDGTPIVISSNVT